MSSSNLKHLFIDERRVAFDQRDDSVTLYPDRDFRLMASERIGYASGSGRSWTATDPSGLTRHCEGRKEAALWLIEQTTSERSARQASQKITRDLDAKAIEEVLSLIRKVRPDYDEPQPLLGNPDARIPFVFSPPELRDLLLDLKGVASADA